MSKKLKPFYNPCPGDIIRDAMEELGWNQNDLAEITGLTGKSVNLIINNKQAITPETAILLGQAFSAPAEMWLNLQARYDLWKIGSQDSPEKNWQNKENFIIVCKFVVDVFSSLDLSITVN